MSVFTGARVCVVSGNALNAENGVLVPTKRCIELHKASQKEKAAVRMVMGFIVACIIVSAAMFATAVFA